MKDNLFKLMMWIFLTIGALGVGTFCGTIAARYVLEVPKENTFVFTYRSPESLTLSHQDDVPNSTRCYYFTEVPDSLDCIYLDPDLRKESVKPLQ